MIWHDYPDRDLLALDLAEVLADRLMSGLHHRERVCLAVPGGTSPGPVFDALSQVHLDWDRVDIMLTDERWVPEDSPRSNTALVKSRLLVERAAKARFLPLYAPFDAPEDALEELSKPIAEVLPLAVVLLGMGTDMHTASIFPEADRLEEALKPDAPRVYDALPDNISGEARHGDAAATAAGRRWPSCWWGCGSVKPNRKISRCSRWCGGASFLRSRSKGEPIRTCRSSCGSMICRMGRIGFRRTSGRRHSGQHGGRSGSRRPMTATRKGGS